MLCDFCDKTLLGDAFVRGEHVLHHACVKGYDAAQKGLTIPCQTCLTTGLYVTSDGRHEGCLPCDAEGYRPGPPWTAKRVRAAVMPPPQPILTVTDEPQKKGPRIVSAKPTKMLKVTCQNCFNEVEYVPADTSYNRARECRTIPCPNPACKKQNHEINLKSSVSASYWDR